eukprot:6948145-Alexandrium_andersonii.AAC.1
MQIAGGQNMLCTRQELSSGLSRVPNSSVDIPGAHGALRSSSGFGLSRNSRTIGVCQVMQEASTHERAHSLTFKVLVTIRMWHFRNASGRPWARQQ